MFTKKLGQKWSVEQPSWCWWTMDSFVLLMIQDYSLLLVRNEETDYCTILRTYYYGARHRVITITIARLVTTCDKVILQLLRPVYYKNATSDNTICDSLHICRNGWKDNKSGKLKLLIASLLCVTKYACLLTGRALMLFFGLVTHLY